MQPQRRRDTENRRREILLLRPLRLGVSAVEFLTPPAVARDSAARAIALSSLGSLVQEKRSQSAPKPHSALANAAFRRKPVALNGLDRQRGDSLSRYSSFHFLPVMSSEARHLGTRVDAAEVWRSLAALGMTISQPAILATTQLLEPDQHLQHDLLSLHLESRHTHQRLCALRANEGASTSSDVATRDPATRRISTSIIPRSICASRRNLKTCVAIWSMSNSSAAPRGRNSSRNPCLTFWNSASHSPGKTAADSAVCSWRRAILDRMPCLNALRDDRRLPSTVRGPVDFSALCRFAVNRAAEFGRLATERLATGRFLRNAPSI